MSEIERSEERDRAIEAALPHVAVDGWTQRALRAGLAEAGFAPEDVSFLFPRGPIEAIEVWSDLVDRRMVERVRQMPLETLRVRDKVAAAVMARLGEVEPHKEAARRALALLALPVHAAAAARITARTVDSVWRAIGDRSADFNWYTKRATLAAVYGATLLFWLGDDSPGAERTRAFLDRRIESLMLIPRLQKRIDAVVSRLPDPFRLLGRLRRAA
ncbi:COQ9 family protein [Elioraea thermophila]|uniref:COQ9 family protein n=1 Tax=Elioraea thermophila TaxID=2185104 RepID=UPI000DF3EF92|nr:COQ9 family protein [Elioraea thermophila]